MDKMREEFEVWANGQGYATDKYDESELSDKYKHLAGTYVIPETRLMIEVWKASRAVLCVEIPKTGEESSFGNYVVFDTELVKEILGNAGVSYK